VAAIVADPDPDGVVRERLGVAIIYLADQGRLHCGCPPTSNLSAPALHDEAAAFVRRSAELWPNGPQVSALVAVLERINAIKPNPERRPDGTSAN